MKHLFIAILLLTGTACAHTVTMNFAMIVSDQNNTIRVNDTSYNSTDAFNMSFSSLGKKYISLSKGNALAAVVSPGRLSGAGLATNYTKQYVNLSTLLLMHMDNSTLDSGPYDNDGTSAGTDCSAAVAGRLNSACYFDSSYIILPKISSLEGQSKYTIAAWVKTLDSGESRALFAQSDDAGNHVIAVLLNNGRARFSTYESGAADIDDNLAINDGQWHHVAVTKSGSTGKIYVDGQLRGNGTVASVSSTTVAYAGRLYSSSTSLTGTIDEIYIINQTLTEGEIYNLYSFQPVYSLVSMKADGRFILTVTNGTYSDIEEKLNMTEALGLVTTTFGHFVSLAPSVFKVFFRLEYSDVDIENRLEWSGIGKLLIKNAGTNNRGAPRIVLELVR